MPAVEPKQSRTDASLSRRSAFPVTVLLLLMILMPNFVSMMPLSKVHQSSSYPFFFFVFNFLILFAALAVVKSAKVFFLLLTPFAFLALPFVHATLLFESVPGKLFVQVSMGTTVREIIGLFSVFGIAALLPILYGTIYAVLVMRLNQSPYINKNQCYAVLMLAIVYAGCTVATTQYIGYTKQLPQVFNDSMVHESYPLGLILNVVAGLTRNDTETLYQKLAISNVQSDPAEITVLVIGESVRSDHLAINGYNRMTTPRLLERHAELVSFPDMLSYSNSTHQSVPKLMTLSDSGLEQTYSLIETYRQAGYQTAWISNQISDIFDPQADYQEFSESTWSDLFRQDSAMLSTIDAAIKQRTGKLFLVVHMLGSHIDYDARYTAVDSIFKPRYADIGSKGQSERHQKALINSYDNTLLALDRFLDSMFNILEQQGAPASLSYTSDHGENLFDDERKLFMHASPHPTRYEVMVPFIVWGNDAFREKRSNRFATLNQNSASAISHRNIFPTMLGLSGIQIQNDRYSLLDVTSNTFKEHPRVVLNANIAIPESELR